ncbi:MAG: hypothetical protein ACAI44_12810 [Candidatus Sericytochromatia bacterium]
MGKMNIWPKAEGEWINKLPGGLKPNPGKPAIEPLMPLDPPPQQPIDKLNPSGRILPMHPPTVEPCIGLQLHSNPIEEVERIRNSKGTSQVQALLEFKETLSASTDGELEKAQNYLTEELAKPGNNDDELLGALLKAVNQELNGRRNHGPIFEVHPFPPRPWNDGPVAD